MFLLADAWSALGGLAAVVAAGAALTTVLYARSTVREAKQGREQSHRDHLEAIKQQKVAGGEIGNGAETPGDSG